MSNTASGIIHKDENLFVWFCGEENLQHMYQTTLLQIRRICENDCIGFDVTNNGRETLVLEKDSQAVAYLSVWSTVRMEDDGSSTRF